MTTSNEIPAVRVSPRVRHKRLTDQRIRNDESPPTQQYARLHHRNANTLPVSAPSPLRCYRLNGHDQMTVEMVVTASPLRQKCIGSAGSA